MVSKALTLHRPWSEAIVRGAKPVENRNWKPPREYMNGGHAIAIHAGRTWDSMGEDFCARLGHRYAPQDSPEGIVGIARLVGLCYAHAGGETVLVWGRWPLAGKPAVRPWFVGVFGWLFDDAVKLAEPIPCRGSRGLWALPEEIVRILPQRILMS